MKNPDQAFYGCIDHVTTPRPPAVIFSCGIMPPFPVPLVLTPDANPKGAVFQRHWC